MMEVHNINFEWGYFHQHVLDSRKEMFSTKQYTDVALISKDKKEIQAHRSIIGPASALLNKLFVTQNPKNPTKKIFLNDIMEDELSALLEFIYLGETVIQEERLSEFKAATKVLQLIGTEDQKADPFPGFIDNQNLSPKENNMESSKNGANVDFEFVSATFDNDESDGRSVNTTAKMEESLNTLDKNYINSEREQATGYIDVGNMKREKSDKIIKNSNKRRQVARQKRGYPMIVPQKEMEEIRRNTFEFDSGPDGSGDRFYKGVNIDVETQCPDCKAQLKSPNVLRVHIIDQHSGHKYECHLCNYQTSRKFSLKFHIQRIHFNIGFRCNVCGYNASKKPRLISHMWNRHQFKDDEFEPKIS